MSKCDVRTRKLTRCSLLFRVFSHWTKFGTYLCLDVPDVTCSVVKMKEILKK